MTTRVVGPGERGMRLERFVRLHFAPAEPVAALLRDGLLAVNGRKARLSDRLEPGQEVRLRPRRAGATPPDAARPDGDDVAAARAAIAALTLYEDAALLVLDKPAGLAVHPGTGTRADLDSLLARLVDPATGERPVLAHRLDKDTSGVIVAARSRTVAAALGRALAARDVVKTYLAVVHGVPAPAAGLVDLPLVKVATPAGARMVAAGGDDPAGLAAVSRYGLEAASRAGTAARLRLSPLTGRQHQLRAHMALIGHPIVGDRIYARHAEGGLLPTPAGAEGGRLRLHALEIAFSHPLTGRAFAIAAPEPAGFGLDLRAVPAADFSGAPVASAMEKPSALP